MKITREKLRRLIETTLRLAEQEDRLGQTDFTDEEMYPTSDIDTDRSDQPVDYDLGSISPRTQSTRDNQGTAFKGKGTYKLPVEPTRSMVKIRSNLNKKPHKSHIRSNVPFTFDGKKAEEALYGYEAPLSRYGTNIGLFIVTQSDIKAAKKRYTGEMFPAVPNEDADNVMGVKPDGTIDYIFITGRSAD